MKTNYSKSYFPKLKSNTVFSMWMTMMCMGTVTMTTNMRMMFAALFKMLSAKSYKRIGKAEAAPVV